MMIDAGRTTARQALALALLCLGGCGGGGGTSSDSTGGSGGTGSGGSGSGGSGTTLTWTPGVFRDPAEFAAQCAVPRVGTDPATGRAYPDR
ncbi:MAG: hypothetical protein ACKOZX_09840, partial [Gammaproteobacteria bacterium]